jgi:phosphoglycolate phosphatase-like HAD superfamily hydrolase
VTALDPQPIPQADLELARRHAPIVYFDEREPFLPQIVGYKVLREPGPSPTFGGYLTLRPEVGGVPGFAPGRVLEGVTAVIEYALWTDWDIQHLYELEHVWSYVDAEGRLLHAEASWHGGAGPLLHEGRLSQEGERPVAYAQPGKHAMAPSPDVFALHDIRRREYALPAGPLAGKDGLLVGGPIAGRLEKNARRDSLANAYLRKHAFVPSFRFTRRWDALDAEWQTCDALIASVPPRLERLLADLEAERAQRSIWAVLFDLGDTLMIEETEEKDGTRTTQRADLFPGAAQLLWDLRRQGYLLGLVADTRPGTYRNVLRQHGVFSAFDFCIISEEIGCEKPDPRMFSTALDYLGLRPDEAEHAAMVGNNLSRDVRGAKAAGMVPIWLRHNERYPLTPADEHEAPAHSVQSFDELRALLQQLG